MKPSRLAFEIKICRMRMHETMARICKHATMTCADPERFVRGGPTLTMFFLADEGRDDQNTTMRGPLSSI